jgi:hypothetical protein
VLELPVERKGEEREGLVAINTSSSSMLINTDLMLSFREFYAAVIESRT